MSGIKKSYIQLSTLDYERLKTTYQRVDNPNLNLYQRLQRATQQMRETLNTQFRHLKQQLLVETPTKNTISNESQNQMVEPFSIDEVQNKVIAFSQQLLSQENSAPSIFSHIQQFSQTLVSHHQTTPLATTALPIVGQPLEIQEAQRWIQAIQKLLVFIEKNDPLATSQTLQYELSLVQNSTYQGHYQAAIATGQQLYQRVHALAIELERQNWEWHTHLVTARYAAAEAVACCEAQKTVEFRTDDEGKQSTVPVDVDFWTEGQWSAIHEQAVAEQQRFETTTALSEDALKQSIIVSLQRKQQIATLIEQAQEAFIASQLRNNIAQSIEISLIEAGWEVADATYTGEDFRQAIHIKLQNYAGDEIVTIIAPEPTNHQGFKNQLTLHFFDRTTNDETFRLQRLNAVTTLLRAEGLECSPPQCAAGTENQTSQEVQVLDFAVARQQRVK